MEGFEVNAGEGPVLRRLVGARPGPRPDTHVRPEATRLRPSATRCSLPRTERRPSYGFRAAGRRDRRGDGERQLVGIDRLTQVELKPCFERLIALANGGIGRNGNRRN